MSDNKLFYCALEIQDGRRCKKVCGGKGKCAYLEDAIIAQPKADTQTEAEKKAYQDGVTAADKAFAGFSDELRKNMIASSAPTATARERAEEVLRRFGSVLGEREGMIDAMLTFAAEDRRDAERWIPVSERLPDVPRGKDMLCWVCVKLDSGKSVVYECHYVNRPVDADAEGREHGWEVTDEDGEPLDAVGWFNIGCNVCYDDFYMADQNTDKIIAWREIVKPNAIAQAREGKK